MNSMEDLLALSSFFLLLSLPSLPSAADYAVPTGYFINCGSADTVVFPSRSFTGDSSALSFTKQGSSLAVSSNSSSPALYRTARIFTALPNSYYTFDIKTGGSQHFLRLHFSPFVSSGGGRRDLSDAAFDVSVRGLTLLRNFTVPKGSNSSVTVKEFLLTIHGNQFTVYFTPTGSSSFAYVNALEVFPVPDGLFLDPASMPNFGIQGRNGNSTVNGREVLATTYRLNVGGYKIEPDDDTLWRPWSTDDGFLQNPDASKQPKPKDITYQDDVTGVSNYTAPYAVYTTARDMNASGGVYSNITWRLDVAPNSTSVVRFHFCDLVSLGSHTLWFYLYVYDNLPMSIDPYEDGIPDAATPFKKDLVIQSGGDGVITVRIGNNSGSSSSSSMNDAYLNGLEVMEMIGTWDWDTTVSKPADKHIGLIVGVAIGGLVLLVVLVVVGIVALRCCRRRKPTETVTVWSPLPGFFGSSHGNKSSDPSSNSPLPNLNLGLTISLSEILSATNNFDSKLMIGRGGFGNVYRGTLKNGKLVAVKRSEPGSSQGLLEFHTEIIVLSKIRHRHLVSLIGYCAERAEMILVYEFVEKGTLRDHLYNTDLPALPWKQRLEICIGAARGLHYLHTGGEIIHRDVKSTNILLDSNYIAKVADFGLSKLTSSLLDESQVSMGFKGTFGYLDPEYMKTQQLTEKSDVYAFGVVLLEVLCARPAIDPMLPREQMNLAEWGISNFHKGSLETIVDPLLSGQINPNSLRKFGETAEKCLKEDDQERPAMGDVLWDMEYALQLQQGPVPRQLYEDSTTNGSSMLGFSAEVQRLPSFSMSLVEDDSTTMTKYEDDTSK